LQKSCVKYAEDGRGITGNFLSVLRTTFRGENFENKSNKL